jgi:hypothetical protein
MTYEAMFATAGDLCLIGYGICTQAKAEGDNSLFMLVIWTLWKENARLFNG